MKYKNLNYLVIIIYLISSNFVYAIDPPNFKNLLIHKDKKKINNIDFINSKSQKVSLKEYSGNVIILNFWATWCAPCREEMPLLNNIKSNEKYKNIEILTINIGGDSYEKCKKFFDDLNINNLKIFLASGVEISQKLSIRGLPTTILVDKNGYEFARILGYINFENKAFLDWLNKYL